MEFIEFRDILTNKVNALTKKTFLFKTDINGNELWELYLNSFPKGTNQMFRERREYDCSTCRHFVKRFGNVVSINDKNELVSIWDIKTNDNTFQPVVDALSKIVKAGKVVDVFFNKEMEIACESNHEELIDREWHHMFVRLPEQFVKNYFHFAPATAMQRDKLQVFRRTMEEITVDCLETVLELIAQNTLYKGNEWEGKLKEILKFKKIYIKLPDCEKHNWSWRTTTSITEGLAKTRNSAVGTLLINLSEDMDLNTAVAKYEAVVAPTNYKRPKAIFTKKMVEQAEQTIEELGLKTSLNRRHATLEDITVNNIIWGNKNAKRAMKNSIFDELKEDVSVSPKKFDKIEEISIEDFIKNVIPNINTMEMLLENRLSPNLLSLIAPDVEDANGLLKWGNNFSWAYNGNITDSMKQNVKAAGGKVDGVLRFSIQWNDNGDNEDDLDAHCIEPNGNLIYFSNARHIHQSSGVLDIDIRCPNGKVANENITWSDINRMQVGEYKFIVHNFSSSGGSDSGFTAEIEYDGEIYQYCYDKPLRLDEKITVAIANFSKKGGLKIIKSLDSTQSSKKIWSLKTNQFYPVSLMMFSPNYWDGQIGIGNKHYFFMMDDCINDSSPSGFFNEFLKPELIKHKRLFEALTMKMRVPDSEHQLSGIGFTSTKRNSVVCKVSGKFTRTIKIKF